MLHLASDIIALVSKSAPIIGSLLGGPLGGIVGHILAGAVGALPGDSADLTDKLTTHPMLDSVLSGLEQQHAPWLKMLALVKMPSKIDLHLIVEFPNAVQSS